MLIHVAENEQLFDLDCQPTMNLEMIQSCLVSLTGIPLDAIVWGHKPEGKQRAEVYKLPDKGRHVFLYNCSWLVVDCPTPPMEDPEVLLPAISPPPSSVHGGHALDKASDPALKALPHYKRRFKYHFDKGLAILDVSQMRFDACRWLLREQ